MVLFQTYIFFKAEKSKGAKLGLVLIPGSEKHMRYFFVKTLEPAVGST